MINWGWNHRQARSHCLCFSESIWITPLLVSEDAKYINAWHFLISWDYSHMIRDNIWCPRTITRPLNEYIDTPLTNRSGNEVENVTIWFIIWWFSEHRAKLQGAYFARIYPLLFTCIENSRFFPIFKHVPPTFTYLSKPHERRKVEILSAVLH